MHFHTNFTKFHLNFHVFNRFLTDFSVTFMLVVLFPVSTNVVKKCTKIHIFMQKHVILPVFSQFRHVLMCTFCVLWDNEVGFEMF